MTLHLISHALCPYVQRVAISLTEKNVNFRRTTIDLADKPDWFLRISPLGKTPVLVVGEQAIFESAAILEYLEDTQARRLHPLDPLTRAQHRGWIEFGASVLNDIAGFYGAATAEDFEAKRAALRTRFERLEADLGQGPYFSGNTFCLVDAVFGPVFRYFDTFEQIADFEFFTGLEKVSRWRAALAERPSIRYAVGPEYRDLLWNFLLARRGHLSGLMTEQRQAAG